MFKAFLTPQFLSEFISFLSSLLLTSLFWYLERILTQVIVQLKFHSSRLFLGWRQECFFHMMRGRVFSPVGLSEVLQLYDAPIPGKEQIMMSDELREFQFKVGSQVGIG